MQKLSRLEKCLVIVCFILLIFHIYQYISYDFILQPLIRVVFYVLQILGLIFFGEKSIPYCLIPFALALTLDITFDNFTPFFMIIFSIMLVDKKIVTCISMLGYCICVFIVCTLHKKTGIHIAIHFGGCFLLSILAYLVYECIKDKSFAKYKAFSKKIKKLDLTAEEENILREIVINKKQLKELGKPNTISKKINTCYKKNNLSSSKELYLVFEEIFKN